MPKKLENYLKGKLKGINLSKVVDVILFGSVVKGKEFPADIDICIIFREKIDSELVDKISSKMEGIKVHINTLIADNFFKKPHSLIKTMLVEGKSILTGRKIINNFGFSSVSLYSYNLSNLKSSDKVKLVYLLRGRKGEIGIVRKLGGEWIADNCFIFPIEKDYEISNIFKKWGIEYKKKEVLIH